MMRIRSKLGWLQVAALALALVACDDDSSGGGEPTCVEPCEEADESGADAGGTDASSTDVGSTDVSSTDASSTDASGGAIDSGDGSDTGVVGTDADDAEVDAGSPDSGQQDVEMVASCTDGIKNGSETDMDCGGSCSPCAKGLRCAVAADCAAPLACGSALTCAAGPTAGFTLAAATGFMPFNAAATSTAAAGDAAIVTTEYNWGGSAAAYEASATHRYKLVGTYSVRQRVTDGNGLVSESAARSITVSDYAVRFSATDKTAQIALTNNRLDVGIATDSGGVRSDASIVPGSGVFYFESKQLFAGNSAARIGLGTAAASLSEPIGEGQSPSFGASIPGGLARNGSTFTCAGSNYQQGELGWVIDYRGATPRVHLITDNSGVPDVGATCTSTVTTALFIMYGGPRSSIGPALRINTGADTTNHPFHFPTAGVKAALVAHSEATAAAALVPGFGKTRAAAADAAPVVTVPGGMTVAVGTPVTLTATASDAVDGVLTAEIKWTDISSQFWSRASGIGVSTGASYAFTPDRIGRYPIEATVTDSAENTTTRTVMIQVAGTLPTFNPVRLVPDALSDPGVGVVADGLGANFTTPGKSGIRANQGLYGQFWYFEAHRATAQPEDLGVGVVIKGGNLIHYSFAEVPWSASLNMASGIWRNLIPQASYATSFNHYGFAVDYTGLHPIVHVIVNHEAVAKMTLDDVWEPIYPMLYGNNNAATTSPDVTVDFTAPFVFNPAIALTNAGESIVGLELGWGI